MINVGFSCVDTYFFFSNRQPLKQMSLLSHRTHFLFLSGFYPFFRVCSAVGLWVLLQ